MPTKISVLGPVPPPYGGVSIHVIRFAQVARDRGWNVIVSPYTGSRSGSRFKTMLGSLRMILGSLLVLVRHRSDITHMHYGGLGYFLAVAPLLLLVSKRSVITFHSIRIIQDTAGAALPVRRFTEFLLNRFALFVCVRKEIGETLRAAGLDRPEIYVMPAFLPPVIEETLRERLPDELAAALVASVAARRTRLNCAAYYLGPGYGHDDIYGVEMLVRAVAALDAESDHELDLFIMVSNPPGNSDQIAAEKAIREVAGRLRKARIHLHYGAPLIPVLAASHAFVRPSKEDGDSVAIREALALGLPVLASNVVGRPAGVCSVDLGSVEDLERELEKFMAGISVVDSAARVSIGGTVEESRAISDFLDALKHL